MRKTENIRRELLKLVKSIDEPAIIYVSSRKNAVQYAQFLQHNDELIALVDLDAFVFAPRELDFVILELILSPAQISVFSKVYKKHHVIPEIIQVRPAYRLLLFYMQILGEADLDEWMNKEALF